MDARYYVILDKFVRDGDAAIVYRHGGTFPAAVRFKGEYRYDKTDLGWTKGEKPFLFPYRINFDILRESSNPPRISYSTVEVGSEAQWTKPNLIDDLLFIADKGKSWNQYMQVSIIHIPKEDYDVLFARL